MNLLILGAGGHGRNCLEIAESTGKYEKIAFLDDGNSKEVYGYPVIGKLNDISKYKEQYTSAFVAIGNNELRKKWILRLEEEGFTIPALISPEAVISARAEIGNGTIIFPFVHVQPGSIVSKGTVLSTGTVVGHDSVVGEYSLIYENCVIRPGAHVNAGYVIRAGSVIEKEIASLPKAEVNNSEKWVKNYKDTHNGTDPGFF